MRTHRQTADNAYKRLMELQRDNGGSPCEELPEVFYPEDYEDPEMQRMAEKVAKNLCAECPLLKPCREWGLVAAVPHGIIGGLTVHERQATPETIS
jgi:WhiB family redox-sensing transcriptional regulator